MLKSIKTFRDKMKIHGKKIDVWIEYKNMSYHKNKVVSLEQNINGELFTGVCRTLTLELEKVENVTFEKETDIYIKLGVKIFDDEEYEYIDWGKFVIYDVKDCVDTKSHKLTLYDHLIDTHIKYQDEPLNLDYSNDDVTVKDLLQAICNKFGFTLKTLTFANSNKIIHEDKYLNLDVTYRDILDEIAGCTGGFIKIFNKDLYVAYPKETGEIIDEEDLKSLDIGNKVGAFNTLVLARSPQEDNIFFPANMENNNNRVAIRIENNQIMDKNREDFIVNLYNKINGLEYYSFECEHYGFGYFEFGDIVTVKDLDGNSYKTILLNIVDNINTGITGKSYAEETEFAETKYEYASSLEKRIRNTEIICDKQNGEIKLLVEEQAKQEEKVAKIELDINTITTTVSQNTTNIANIKSDAVSEAIKATEQELGIKLKDYPTTAQVSTIIETKAGEIETRLNGTITTQMKDYVTQSIMDTTIQTSINGFSSTVSQIYLTKTSASNDFVEKKKVISSINQTSEKVSIDATKINLNGAVTANNYFKINTDGSMETIKGKIANINIDSNGLHYSGSSSTDGFGLWRNGYHSWNGSYIIFHAGANGVNVGSAPFKIYQNGMMEASSGKIGGFRIGSNVLESDSVGISANERWAFWTKIAGTTTSRISWNGDIECSSIMVGGTPLVRSVTTSGQFISQIRHMTSYLEYTVDGYGAFGINGVWQSDTKLKKNIEDTKMSGLDFVNGIRHIEFDWKRDGGHEKIGYSANNLKEIDEGVVFAVEQPEEYEYDSLLQIDETKIIPYLSKAIQELYAEVEKLKVKEV